MNGRRYRDFDEWTLRKVLKDNRFFYARVKDVLGIDHQELERLIVRWGIIVPLLTKRIARLNLCAEFQIKHPSELFIFRRETYGFKILGFKNHQARQTIKKEWGIDPDLGAVTMEYDGATDCFTFYQYTKNTAEKIKRHPSLSM